MDKKYTTPKIETLDASKVVASLGPASAGNSFRPATSSTGGGSTWNPTRGGSPMG